MRQFAFFLLASGLFLTGCIGNDSLGSYETAQRNIENLARISPGMSNAQVFQIMRHPYKSESFQIEGDRYEVWFYVTRFMIMDQSEPAHSNLTPLIFRNGVLEGKGYNDYHRVMNVEAAVENEKSPPAKEDYDLEKALTPPPGSKPAQPTKPVQPQPATPAPAQKKPPAKPKTTTNPPAKTNPSSSQPSKQPSSPSSSSSSSVREPSSGQQPPAPTQPRATQPTAPVQPGSQPAPSKNSSQGNVTMSKSSSNPPPEEKQTTPSSQKTSPDKSKEKKQKNDVPLNKKDEEMLQEEQQEDFDFW